MMTETMSASLDDDPALNLILTPESDIQSEAETALTPAFEPIEFTMPNDAPNTVKDTAADAGKLTATDDRVGNAYEITNDTDPEPYAEIISERRLIEPCELSEVTIESDNQTVHSDTDSPNLILLLRCNKPKDDPEITTTDLPEDGSSLLAICGTGVL
jgi:hypothetical protein